MEEFNELIRVNTFAIPDKLCTKAGVAATFIKGNEFAIFPYQHRPANLKKDGQSQFAPCSPKIHMIRQEITLFHPIIRKLVNESNGTFLYLQSIVEKAGYGDLRCELLKISRQYRAIIRACLENLIEVSESVIEFNEKELLSSYETIFYGIDYIWNLCEILYIDNIPGDIVLPQLMEWIRLYFPNHENSAAQILEACEKGAEERTDYWDTVTGMILQGRIDIARGLMKLHSKSDTNQFKLADNILKSMPTYNAYSNLSMNEFTVNWKHWQIDCEAKINAGSFESEPRLDHIMRIVAGQMTAFELARESVPCWRDLIGAYALYAAPGTKRADLGRIAHICANIKSKTSTPPSQLDTIVLALMEDDIHRVLHEIQQMSDNGWFATHLIDLLYHSGNLAVVDEHQTNMTNQLRESLILDYGTLLASHHSLWAVGLSYLAQCWGRGTGEGAHRAALLVARLPLGSEQRIMKILNETKKYNMHTITESICQRQAMVLRAKGRGEAALSWALRGRAGPLAARLADEALKEYARTGTLVNTELVGTLGPDMMLSDRLVFLAKYCEFHRLYKNSEFKEAASLLISLLASKITPNYFWATLLTDALPLLECDVAVFGTDDTFEIMHCLEERISSDELGEKLELLRLALARNLARTMLLDDEEQPGEDI